MMKLSNQQIQKHISDLPDNVRKAVVTFDWSNQILNIGNDHGLHMDQIDAFRYETMMVILGQSPSTNYQQALISSMNIKKDVAEELVIAANADIFRELQKRAFSTNDKEPEPAHPHQSDDYLEPIGHNDLRGPMAEEGVHLIDENNSKPQTTLQDEIDKMTSRNPKMDQRSLDSFEMSTEEREDTIGDNNEFGAETELVFKDEYNQEIKPSTYNEPIDEHDLKGIAGHRIDTSILKQQNHINPDHAFHDQPLVPKGGRDLGQKKYGGTLDKHLMENPFIAKGDSIDVSPTEQEQIKEDGNFLQSLKNES